jgi:rhodanese-related sulfurtransferase
MPCSGWDGETAVLLDVRTPEEWVTDSHAPEAVLIPLDELGPALLPTDEAATIW